MPFEKNISYPQKGPSGPENRHFFLVCFQIIVHLTTLPGIRFHGKVVLVSESPKKGILCWQKLIVQVYPDWMVTPCP